MKNDSRYRPRRSLLRDAQPTARRAQTQTCFRWLRPYVKEVAGEVGLGGAQRSPVTIAAEAWLEAGKPADLTFICTAQFATQPHVANLGCNRRILRIENVNTFRGTQATACTAEPSLPCAGSVSTSKRTSGDNPIYFVRYARSPVIRAYSAL